MENNSFSCNRVFGKANGYSVVVFLGNSTIYNRYAADDDPTHMVGFIREKCTDRENCTRNVGSNHCCSENCRSVFFSLSDNNFGVNTAGVRFITINTDHWRRVERIQMNDIFPAGNVTGGEKIQLADITAAVRSIRNTDCESREDER